MMKQVIVFNRAHGAVAYTANRKGNTDHSDISYDEAMRMVTKGQAELLVTADAETNYDTVAEAVQHGSKVYIDKWAAGRIVKDGRAVTVSNSSGSRVEITPEFIKMIRNDLESIKSTLYKVIVDRGMSIEIAYKRCTHELSNKETKRQHVNSEQFMEKSNEVSKAGGIVLSYNGSEMEVTV